MPEPAPVPTGTPEDLPNEPRGVTSDGVPWERRDGNMVTWSVANWTHVTGVGY
jgi:hypothetical protein